MPLVASNKENSGATTESTREEHGRAAITLKLTQREMKVLEELAEKKELTKVAVIRQALRVYQLLDSRLARGEKVLLEDAKQEKTTELVMI
jgi:hypothetical protein